MKDKVYVIKDAHIYDYNRHGIIAFVCMPDQLPTLEEIRQAANEQKKFVVSFMMVDDVSP